MNKNQCCPLCQQSNHCGLNDSAGCWCMQREIPAELIALLPASATNLQCICATCIASFNLNPQHFKPLLLSTI
jgi:hypothetical protein